jgi:diguanylate cyclase (GGDEF)-like protein
LDGFPRAAGTVAVLFIDLDGFKGINDSLGHYVGDELLVTVSQRLLSVIRPGDTVARLGGDEFAILLHDIEDPSTGIAVAERAVATLRQPIEIAGQAISISASVGIAFADLGTSTELILSQADAAMYDAKASGKDQVQRFQPAMRTRIVHRLELRNAFHGALERGEFRLDFQPQLSLRDGTLEGFEALVRWAHPLHGELGPADFIGLAEETGFIVPLGQWILDTACSVAGTWPVRNGKHLSVSVNVSGRQLRSDHFLDDVKIALSYSGLRPEDLVLEVTESIFILNPGVTAAVLNRLSSVGVRLAVDDFGTGYSSLSSLNDYPIDHLKIDRSFVALLRNSQSDGAALIQAIVRLAHELGLSAVAEGVETVDQHRALCELGCDTIQGYLLSHPLDGSATRTFAETFSLDPRHPLEPGSNALPPGRSDPPPGTDSVTKNSWLRDKGEETRA